MKTSSKLFALLLAICCLAACGTSQPVDKQGETQSTTGGTKSQTGQSGAWPTEDFSAVTPKLQTMDSAHYDQGLAEMAALYAMLAYDDYSYSSEESSYYTQTERRDAPEPLQAQLSADGYLHVESQNYKNDNEHDISYTLACQNVKDGEVLLAVILRGTDGVEWLGNMDVGRGSRHESFEKANQSLQSAIKAYISKYKLDNIIFFVTGHSRGAAVANLLTADLNQNAAAFKTDASKVFCYAFATPNNTTAPAADKNIFNFTFEDDFVPQVPLKKWGFGKYGSTATASAQALYESNSEFNSRMNRYANLSYGRAPSFDKAATEKVLEDFYELAPTVEVYYTKEYMMAPDHGLVTGEEDQTMHGFMRNYIGNAAAFGLDDLGSSIGAALKRLPAGNDVKAIADYFIEGWLPPEARRSINDTHQAFTYYAALKTGGFSAPKE